MPPLGKTCQAWGHAVKLLGWGHAMLNITSYNATTKKVTHKMQDTPYWIGVRAAPRAPSLVAPPTTRAHAAPSYR